MAIDIRKIKNFTPYKFWLSKQATSGEQPIEVVVKAFNLVFNKSEEIGKCKPCAMGRFKNALSYYRGEYVKYLSDSGKTFEQELKECIELDCVNGTTDEMQQEFVEKYLGAKKEVASAEAEQPKKRTRRKKEQ